jgi:hypothetical protein
MNRLEIPNLPRTNKWRLPCCHIWLVFVVGLIWLNKRRVKPGGSSRLKKVGLDSVTVSDNVGMRPRCKQGLQAMMHQSSQQRIRARSEVMVQSRSSAVTAARGVSVRDKIIHCRMRLGSPVRRVASGFENRCRSIGSKEWLPQPYNSRSCALISSVLAARLECMVLLLMP